VTLPILWLYGADAVGKSTVAWEIYTSLTSRRIGAAYVDTDYLGFCSPLPDDDPSPLVAANLAAIWPNFEAAGAECMVVAGVVVSAEQRERYEAAIPGAALTLCLLRARPEMLAERIIRRGRAEGAGSDDAASGLTLERLREYGASAGRFAALLDSLGIEDLAVDTDGVPVPDVARSVLAAVGDWPVATLES
jgi:hypothetical protein